MRAIRFGDRVTSETGSKTVDLFAPKVRKDGVIELVKSGEKNLYEDIQSYKDSVDIHVILAQYANGDVTALEKRQGVYEDIVNMPKSYAEMFQRLKDGEKAFYELPVEVREKFGHSFEKWLITSGTDDWIKAMQVKPIDNLVIEKEEVKEVSEVNNE